MAKKKVKKKKKLKKSSAKTRGHEEILEEIKENYSSAVSLTNKFFEKEVKKAGGEARKALQNVRNLAKELRVAIQQAKKEM